MYSVFASSDTPPDHRTRVDNHPTLLVSWWCTICALFIIITRLFGRFVRTERLFAEDVIMALAMIPLLIRMGLVDVILLYGTNNVQTAGLTAENIYHRSIGARLVLASRIFYALYIWTAKYTVLQFLKRITSSVWTRTYERALRAIRWFLALAFLAVVIVTLAECHPFSHYWQVVPDPGPRCRNGFAQVITMGVADIITDVALVALPLPIIIKSTMPAKRKVGLCMLFALSLTLIAITAYRIHVIIATHGRQQLRSLWASLEILAATGVANALILGSFLRDRGVKKLKYKGVERLGSFQPSINRIMARNHWGSDEDLFRTLGCRMDSVTTSMANTSGDELGHFGGPFAAGSALESQRAPLDEIESCDDQFLLATEPRSPFTDNDLPLQSSTQSRIAALQPGTFHRVHDFAVGEIFDLTNSNSTLADAGGLLGPSTESDQALRNISSGSRSARKVRQDLMRKVSPSPAGKTSQNFVRRTLPSPPQQPDFSSSGLTGLELQDIGGLLKDTS